MAGFFTLGGGSTVGTVRVREQFDDARPNVEDWMRDAECRDDDPRAYDEQYDDKPPAWVRCFGCGVRAKCFTFALTHGYEGVWGGTTVRQRNRINRSQRRAKCPGEDCGSTDIRRGTKSDTCGACGLSWPVPGTSKAS